MKTSLYEKVFIDGFEKPSYVVACVPIDRVPSTDSIRKTLEAHPRLRSTIRYRFGVPTHLEPHSPEDWLKNGGFIVLDTAPPRFEEELLSTPSNKPLTIYAVRSSTRPRLIIKIHHAFIDASSGFKVLEHFARIEAGLEPRPCPPPARRSASFRDWLRHAQLRPRLPKPSIETNFTPTQALEHTPVEVTERIVRRAPIAQLATKHGATLAEIVASALLSSMNNTPDVGLMIAKAARRAHRAADAAFRAETCVVSMPRPRQAHLPTTLAALRESMRDPRHNDVALAALYVARKLKLRPKPRREAVLRHIFFTLSDITAFRFPHVDTRVLASPTSFDHAGMIVTRAGPDTIRLAIIAHRGALTALSADEILTRTLTNLGTHSHHDDSLSTLQA